MRNSWYRLNGLELTIGWVAGMGAWFGLLYFLVLLLQRKGNVLPSLYVASVLSTGVLVGYVAAMRFHKWGFKLYLWSVGLLLLLYAVSGSVQKETQGVVFWFHTGVLPLHLLLFGLPKIRHLLSQRGGDPGEIPKHREECIPPSFLTISTTLPAGVGLLGLVLYLYI